MTGSLFAAAPRHPEYAFTEFVTISFSQPVDLQNQATPEGQIWFRTIQLYLGAAGTKALWWGSVVGSPQVVKLIVDWRSASERDAFLASPAMASLVASWTSDIQTGFTSSRPTLYELDPQPSTRQNVFRPPRQFSEDNITILLTFNFLPSFELEALQPSDEVQPARTRRLVWENSWDIFAHSALRSDGGIISSRGDRGWALEGVQSPSWMGAFRFMSVQTAQDFLRHVDEQANDSQRMGWGRLMNLIGSGGIQVELLKMVFAG